MENYNDNLKYSTDTNECVSRGVCTSSPVHSALQELILLFIRYSCFYLLQLKEIGIDNELIKHEIFRDLAALVSINEFTDKQLYEIVMKDYSILHSLKTKYKNNVEKSENRNYDLRLPSAFKSDLHMSKVISIGERIFLSHYKKYSLKIRNLREIIYVMAKGIAYNSLKVKNFASCSFEPYSEVLESLNLLNDVKPSEDKILNKILNLASYNYELQILTAQNVIESYGPISETQVSLSSQVGKAILVSGDNLSELKMILDLTTNKGISVYTHSELAIANCLDSFKQYKNLIGHYGGNAKSSIIDFATFPGAILLAGTSKNSSDYLYRGRIFSNDYILHTGVKQIEANDYTPVIKAAMNAKGFKTGRKIQGVRVGYNYTEVIKKFEQIKSKVAKDEIARIYIISINPNSEIQNEYFNVFFDNLKQDEYVISFSYSSDKSNVYTINTANYIPFTTKLISAFLKDFDHYNKITFIFTTCSVMALSSIVLLHNKGVKSIYLSGCSPSVLNPSVFFDFRNLYGVNIISNPISDLENIRLNKNTQS